MAAARDEINPPLSPIKKNKRGQALLSCLVAITSAADEHRPVRKKDDRGKRNLEYQISHHYSGPLSYRLERRISTTGPQHPLYPPSQFFPGPPRPYSPYRKGRPYSYPVPPYAVQMEPLVQYSQRDPLYDTNIFSLNADSHNDLGRDDLLTETNHIQGNVHQDNHIYGTPKPHIIERPVYIKEPEPIIEIIIKESNVSLPPPPTLPPLKKKKEQVQVFYVKYKKNPNGVGKDSIIYDKPIPAISPKIPEDHEEEEEDSAPYNYHQETVTSLPPPTTTLRTIIKPDSEVYHSPSGVKVTFGKEGFDYEKRSSKPQDYNPSQPVQQFPQGRQLSSFSNAYFKRPSTNQNFQSPPPGYRAPQPYRPFVFPPTTSQNYKSFGRQTVPQVSSQPKYPFQSPPYTKPTSQQYPGPPSSRYPAPPSPQFSHTISHPPPPHFQNSRPPQPQIRQPVPYKPFDNYRPQQSFSQPPQPPQHHNLPPNSNPSQQHPNPSQQHPNPSQQHPNPSQQQIQFRPETHFPPHQQLPLSEPNHVFNPPRFSQPIPEVNIQPQYKKEPQSLRQSRPQQTQFPKQPPQAQYQQQFSNNQFNGPKIAQNQQPQEQQPLSQNEHLNNLQTAQSILPPGGQLIQAVPKFEQHVSEYQTTNNQRSQPGLSQQEYQHNIHEQFNFNNGPPDSTKLIPHPELLQEQQSIQQHQNIQQQLEQREQQQQQQEQNLRSAQQYYRQQEQRNLQQEISYTTPKAAFVSTRQSQPYISSTPRIAYQTTTTKPTTTTTQEPEKPSTTTKDPKILEAQLPDEVPDELREQLLSSGILNNADISILDYDKVGDIPLSALPPEQLANFYGAGGGAQLAAGSAPIPTIVDRDGSAINQPVVEEEDDQEPGASEVQEVVAEPPSGVEMKVVKYDPDTDKGQRVQESYVEEGAQQVEPVVLNDDSYNRYLPLKVNGTQFPIPDVAELKGKKISSVVVLAPVTYDFSVRKTRETSKQESESNDVDLIQGDALKQLLADPTKENFNKFLEKENKTRSDKQAVILLVTDPQDNSSTEKEIYMYDIATESVSKLSGELSSAFVEAAEANSSQEETEDSTSVAASNIVETRVPFTENTDREDSFSPISDLEESPSDIVESKVPLIDPIQEEDMETDASEQLQNFVDISGMSIGPQQDLAVSGSEENSNLIRNDVLVRSGYSKTGHS